MRTNKNRLAALAALAIGAIISSPASAFTATQDGVGVNVFYSQAGQTVSFHFQADFTGTVTGGWLGSTMDQIGLQFGDANNNGISVLTGLTPTLDYSAAGTSAGDTNTTGGWHGFMDKAGGNNPCLAGSKADAVCYQINPGTVGEAGDQVIGAAVYNWYFDVTFGPAFDVAAMLAESHSIKMQTIRFQTNGNCRNQPITNADCWKNAAQFSQNEIFESGDDDDDDDDDDTDVPEPGSLALLGLGLLGLGLSRRRTAR